MILEGKIKDAKMSSFSSDFQTLIKHWFSLWIIDEFENGESKPDTTRRIRVDANIKYAVSAYLDSSWTWA